MSTIKIKTSVIERAAEIAKTTPEKFISESRSVSCGRKVCAHFERIEGDFSIFNLSRGVRTLRRTAELKGKRAKNAS